MTELGVSTSAAILFERNNAQGCSKRFVAASSITSMPSAKSAKPTSFRVFHCPIGFSIGTSPIVPHWWTIGALGLLLGMTYQ